MSKVIPILLAGGSGTRLWPLSRKTYPKQFSKLINKSSLFQLSALRFVQNENVAFAPPVTLTNSDFRFIVSEQLQEIGVDPGPIILEPSAKNTAPAILAASLYAYKLDQESTL